MCGIYGLTGAVQNQVVLMKALAVLNKSRGVDACGVVSVGKGGRHRLTKRANYPNNVIAGEAWEKIVRWGGSTLIGHNRFATMGAKWLDRNAHPFRFGGTVGAHNGMLSNVGEMREYTGKRFNVDSQYVLWCLENSGTLGPARGTVNVAWTTLREGEADLNLVKMNNPLSVVVVEGWRGVVFSSEAGHLYDALDIAGVGIEAEQEVVDGDWIKVSLDAAGYLAEIERDKAPFMPSEWEKRQERKDADRNLERYLRDVWQKSGSGFDDPVDAEIYAEGLAEGDDEPDPWDLHWKDGVAEGRTGSGRLEYLGMDDQVVL